MDYIKLEELRQISTRAFSKAASCYYRMSEESLSVLLQDYDLIPKDEFGPPNGDAVPLSMTEIAKKVGLPIKVIGRVQDLGVINCPITCSDFDFLKSLRNLWGNHFILKCQLARLSQKQREKIPGSDQANHPIFITNNSTNMLNIGL